VWQLQRRSRKSFWRVPEMHLCTLLGGGKASLPEFGVAKDLALEDLHVWGEACSSGRVGGRCGSELDCLDGDIGASLKVKR